MNNTYSNAVTSACANSTATPVHNVNTNQIQQLLHAQQQQQMLSKILAQTPTNQCVNGCLTNGAWQQQQQAALQVQNAGGGNQPKGQAKGKGKGKGKGKAT